MDHPLIKACWFSSMILGRMSLSLFAKSFAIKQYNTLQTEIGQKPAKETGLGIFGTSVIKVIFTSFNSLPIWKKFMIATP